MPKPSWNEYAVMLADLYRGEIDFLIDRGHESVEISWRGSSNTAIRASTADGFLLATNACGSSELANATRAREPWFLCRYRGADGDAPVILGQGSSADFAIAYRQAMGL
ncbi:hypothetical protein ACIA8C_09780 [Nocardia sp. NPDC051321]|uniref:hypothetical protein n=1 Tax=Nocardia sp. NPDC051321 TaxID=3364323 RepID=UPI00378C8416